MNTHDFLMTLGAKSGLGLDSESGLLTGNSNGFKVNVLPGGKLKIYVAPVKDGKHPSSEQVEAILNSEDITKVENSGEVVVITTKSISTNVKGAGIAANAISSITLALKNKGYEDDSENCVTDMEITGKKFVSISGDSVSDYLNSVLGVFIGGALAFGIMWLLGNVSSMLAGWFTVVFLLFLPILGFEIAKGRKSFIGLVILFIGIFITADLLVRIKVTASTMQELKSYNYMVNQLNPIMQSVSGESLETLELSFSKVYSLLPSVFSASTAFLKEMVIGYAMAVIYFTLSLSSYLLGNNSVFDYFFNIYGSITGSQRSRGKY